MDGEPGKRTRGPRDELAATIRACATQHGCGAVRAERAFERADAGAGRARRKVFVAALAVRRVLQTAHLQAQSLSEACRRDGRTTLRTWRDSDDTPRELSPFTSVRNLNAVGYTRLDEKRFKLRDA